MSKFVIIPDSASDLTENLMKEYNILEVVPLTLALSENEVIDAKGDWNKISSKEFYERLKKNNKIATGAPSPEKFISVFEKYLKEGYDVLTITLSSALSSTNQYANVAAKELNEKYPDRKVLVLDSKRYSTSELLLIIHASNLQKQGKDIQSTYDELLKIRNCLHQAGPMDDLMYLASKGRLSNTKAFMGTIIGLNPIGEVSSDGLTTVLCKVKGGKKALKVSLEYMKRTIVDPNNQIVVIAHSNREEKAKLYEQMIREEINPKEIIMTEVGMACAPNIGPGLCAAYYYGTEISNDLSIEKEIFNEIISKK